MPSVTICLLMALLNNQNCNDDLVNVLTSLLSNCTRLQDELSEVKSELKQCWKRQQSEMNGESPPQKKAKPTISDVLMKSATKQKSESSKLLQENIVTMDLSKFLEYVVLHNINVHKENGIVFCSNEKRQFKCRTKKVVKKCLDVADDDEKNFLLLKVAKPEAHLTDELQEWIKKLIQVCTSVSRKVIEQVGSKKTHVGSIASKLEKIETEKKNK